MSIFAISDLHLSKSKPKPMDIFGPNWTNHWDKIKSHWKTDIREEDTVLIPGDISWAMNLDEALEDLLEISELPGRKILIQGNHEYWWQSPTKIRKVLPPGMEIIQNDYVDIGDFLVCGTRGWMLPGDDRFGEKDLKIFKRELIRLELSLSKGSSASDKPIIVMIHYPPIDEKGAASEFVSVMKKYNAKICIYGHLHGESLKSVTEGFVEGIEFFMVSCDYLDFKPKKIY